MLASYGLRERRKQDREMCTGEKIMNYEMAQREGSRKEVGEVELNK